MKPIERGLTSSSEARISRDEQSEKKTARPDNNLGNLLNERLSRREVISRGGAIAAAVGIIGGLLLTNGSPILAQQQQPSTANRVTRYGATPGRNAPQILRPFSAQPAQSTTNQVLQWNRNLLAIVDFNQCCRL